MNSIVTKVAEPSKWKRNTEFSYWAIKMYSEDDTQRHLQEDTPLGGIPVHVHQGNNYAALRKRCSRVQEDADRTADAYITTTTSTEESVSGDVCPFAHMLTPSCRRQGTNRQPHNCRFPIAHHTFCISGTFVHRTVGIFQQPKQKEHTSEPQQQETQHHTTPHNTKAPSG
ncbi:hypothetical protein Pelo_10073 [Pelomyxa schiedti]|nr:hypothetical protein Pelo_10073 [Pelomyxa schiedti]